MKSTEHPLTSSSSFAGSDKQRKAILECALTLTHWELITVVDMERRRGASSSSERNDAKSAKQTFNSNSNKHHQHPALFQVKRRCFSALEKTLVSATLNIFLWTPEEG